jgi:NitT/TauT family transport system permease protein
VIACEVLSQPHFAIGTGMQNAQTYLLVAEVLAWTLVAILLGYLFETLINRLEKKIIRWRD